MSMIKKGTITGMTVGTAIAVLLLSLEYTRPFSPNMNSLVERATFKLCPLYILGFSKSISSEAAVVGLAIIGNGFIYGAVFGGIAAVTSLFRRSAGDKKLVI